MSRQTSSFGLFVQEANGRYKPASLASIIAVAREGLDASFVRKAVFCNPGVVKDYLSLKLGQLEHEVFVALFLDSQNRLIECREMFRGSIAQTSVYPREIVKAALALNAAAVIFAHNHPSGVPEPSRADEALTQSLKATLATLEIRTLDHLVVGGGSVVSFAERGLL
jgi:DNA repair protein RadC